MHLELKLNDKRVTKLHVETVQSKPLQKLTFIAIYSKSSSHLQFGGTTRSADADHDLTLDSCACFVDFYAEFVYCPFTVKIAP